MSAVDQKIPAVRMSHARHDPTRPLVSVIVPVYNAAEFIWATLTSVSRQTYQNLEIIVIDDGSTDRTAEVVRQFVAYDSRVTLHRQENQGVAAARNCGIRMARANLIAPIDADDLWKPTKIEQQVRHFVATGDRLGLVYTWWRVIDGDGLIIGREAKLPDLEGSVFPLLIERNWVGCGSTPLMRRDYVMEVGGYDSELRAQNAEGCEDWKLYLALAERYEFALVREFLVGYRRWPGMMSSNRNAMRRSTHLVLSEFHPRHPGLFEKVLSHNSSLLDTWSNIEGTSAPRLGVGKIRSDPAAIVGLRRIRRKLWLPFRSFYRCIRKVSPELAQSLKRNIRRTVRKPFLDDT